MGKPIPKMVREAGGKNLRLILQTPEGARVDDAITVTLEIVAVRMAKFGKAAAARHLRPEAEVGDGAFGFAGGSHRIT